MTDPATSGPRPDMATLVYPFEAVPAPAEALPVAPGVMWMRMRMPMQLDHINLWAIEDGASWAVVDTGMRTEDTVAAWRQLLAKGNDGRRIGRAQELARRQDAPLGCLGPGSGDLRGRSFVLALVEDRLDFF